MVGSFLRLDVKVESVDGFTVQSFCDEKPQVRCVLALEKRSVAFDVRPPAPLRPPVAVDRLWCFLYTRKGDLKVSFTFDGPAARTLGCEHPLFHLLPNAAWKHERAPLTGQDVSHQEGFVDLELRLVEVELSSGTSLSSWLSKQGHVHKAWRRRWFSLKGPFAYYFPSKTAAHPAGVIPLRGSVVETVWDANKGRGGFAVASSDGTRFPILADSRELRDRWVVAVRVAASAPASDDMHVEKGEAEADDKLQRGPDELEKGGDIVGEVKAADELEHGGDSVANKAESGSRVGPSGSRAKSVARGAGDADYTQANKQQQEDAVVLIQAAYRAHFARRTALNLFAWSALMT